DHSALRPTKSDPKSHRRSVGQLHIINRQRLVLRLRDCVIGQTGTDDHGIAIAQAGNVSQDVGPIHLPSPISLITWLGSKIPTGIRCPTTVACASAMTLRISAGSKSTFKGKSLARHTTSLTIRVRPL